MAVIDLLNPDPKKEKRLHKKKRLVQSPNSYFMDVRCPGCFQIHTVFSHATTVVVCPGCALMLCQPTGGKCRLTEGCSFRRKQVRPRCLPPSRAARALTLFFARCRNDSNCRRAAERPGLQVPPWMSNMS
jgi:small subunit ribosomal protein S27e